MAVLLLLVLCPHSMSAQNGVNSPYSRYGLGMLSDQASGMGKGLGGLGIGLRLTDMVNVKNPASYSTVDTLTFIADLGFTLQNANFSENDVRVNSHNSYMDHLTMQFRILPKVGMTVSFLPFANVGYSFSNEQIIRRDEDGEVIATNTYSGTGGVRQFMGGLGWRPSEWLSVGFNGSYLVGNLSHSVSNSYNSSSVQSRVRSSSADFSVFKLDLGVQGTVPFKENRKLVVGLTYTPAQELEGDAYFTDEHSTTVTDTVSNAFSIPTRISAGLSYEWNKRLVGADVTYESWSDAKFFGEKYGCDRISVAAGYLIKGDDLEHKLLGRSSYQLGVNFSQPYFMVGDRKGPIQLGMSAGMTIPVFSSYNSISYIHLSGEYKRVQPMSKGMITENYIGINIGVTFKERWFMKLMVN